MAISGPYVHSNYSNFYSQVTRGLGFEGKKSLPEVMNEITTELNRLKAQLYEVTKGALNGKSVDELNDYFFNPEKTLLGVAWKVLQDPSIEKQMVDLLTEDAWEIDQDKLGEGVAKTLKADLVKQYGEKETGFNFYEWSAAIAMEAFAAAAAESKLNGSANTGTDSASKTPAKRGNIYSVLQIKTPSSTSKNLSRGSVSEKYVGKVVREILKEEGIAKEKTVANSQKGEKLFKIFKPAFWTV